MSTNQYFASKEASELTHDLENKLSEWSGYLDRNGVQSRWVKSYRLYFGRHFKNAAAVSDSEILRGGKDGELALVTVNHYRNLLKHILVLTTSQKPAFDARAINSDLKSLQQARLANNILDAYMREKRLDRYLKLAAEQALVFGKGFIKCVWEPSLGRPHSVEQREDSDGNPVERVVYEGDVDVSCPSPFDVLVDQSQEDWTKCQWVLIRSYKNKFDLAARYPELKDKIEGLKTKSDLEGARYISLQNLDETSDVPVYEFYHKRSDALPNGRYVLFCNGDTVLYDGAIPYKRLPIFRITPGEIFGSTDGYSDAFDLMGLQEAINVLSSAIFSNQNAFAVQNVLVPEGSNISIDQISDALAMIKYNPTAGEPKALQLTQTPPEVFKFLEVLERAAETLSGVNSVARGNPDTALGKGASGTAVALIQSMAVQYASGFQQSWAELLEDVGTFILDLLKDFASTERMVAMAGKHNRGAMVSFTKDDLKNVDRVVVDLGNPLSRTTAGRVQIADTLLDKGKINTPQEYFNVINSGNLDPIFEGQQSQIDLIRRENEDLMDGKPVKALVGDAHVLHLQEHRSIINDPDLRRRAAMGEPQAEQIIAQALSHEQEHMQLYRSQDPLWSMVAGEPPAPPQPGMMPPQRPPQGPPQPQGPGPQHNPPGPANHPPQVPQPSAPGPQGPMPGGPH